MMATTTTSSGDADAGSSSGSSSSPSVASSSRAFNAISPRPDTWSRRGSPASTIAAQRAAAKAAAGQSSNDDDGDEDVDDEFDDDPMVSLAHHIDVGALVARRHSNMLAMTGAAAALPSALPADDGNAEARGGGELSTATFENLKPEEVATAAFGDFKLAALAHGKGANSTAAGETEILDDKPTAPAPATTAAKGDRDVEQARDDRGNFVVDEEFEKIVNKLVPTNDDPTTPSLTLRVWILGTVFCVLLAWINQLFQFRTNPLSVTSYVTVLLAYPLGRLLAKYTPRRQWRVPLLGVVDTNPGPFSIKEHVLIGIFGSTGFSGVYGSENIVVQEIFYKTDIGPVFGVLFLLATSTLGFGIAGVCRKVLIRPRTMIWPSILPSVALFSSFHEGKTKLALDSASASSGSTSAAADSASVTDLKPTAEGTEKDKDAGEQNTNMPKGKLGRLFGGRRRRISRLGMFGLCAVGMGLFYLFGAGFFSPVLQNLPLLCWITPKSSEFLQMIGSPTAGTGVLSLTLDWSTVGGAPINIPYWASVNVFISTILFAWILVPLAWKGNWWSDSSKFSIVLNSAALTDKNGKRFSPRDIVDPQTNAIIEQKYQDSKPFLMSPFFAFSYLGSMASFTGSISHTAVWYGRDIWHRIRRPLPREEDVHCRLIDKYPEVPNAWYYGFFVVCLGITVITCQFSGIGMQWYHAFLSVVVAILATIPFALVLATTGVGLAVNVISEFIIGLILPGRPLVMMAFKTLSVSVSAQCLTLLGDLKLGHYMKIPPRHVFVAQMFSQIVTAFVVYATVINYIRDPERVEWILKEGKVEGLGRLWGGSQPNVFYNASLIWGAIGPQRFFFESIYSGVIIWGLVLGAVTPVVIRACSLALPKAIPWRLLHTSLLFGVGGPPAAQNFALTAFITATLFQFYLYRYRQSFWARYNYVMATGFDVGVAVVSFVTTFILRDFNVSAPTWALNPPEGTFGKFGDGCG